MLLKQIVDEYEELYDAIKDIFDEFFDLYRMDYGEFTIDTILGYSRFIRRLSKTEAMLLRKSFISQSVESDAHRFVDYLRLFYDEYDATVELLAKTSNVESDIDHIFDRFNYFKRSVWTITRTCIELRCASRVLSNASIETWELLPDNVAFQCENIVISSETVSTSLSDVSKDIESIDGFLNNIYSLINKDKQNSYFLRKVETGSLSIVISCITAVAPIISFVFFVIKLCQNTEKRYLNNKAKRLELIDKKLDMAKKILEIDSQNTEANEVIQKSMVYLLQYFENNPRGTINGESYDIGAEILKIEEKKDE